MFPPSPSGKRPALSEDLEKVIFKKASPKAIIPLKATSGSIGYDLFSLDSYVVKPHKPCKINTGIAVSFPKGVYGRIAGRSGLAAKNNIIVMGMFLYHLNCHLTVQVKLSFVYKRIFILFC